MPQDQAKKTTRGGPEENRTLAKRDLIDLRLVLRRINGSTYEDGDARLFVILYPVERQFIVDVLSRVIGDQDGGS